MGDGFVPPEYSNCYLKNNFPKLGTFCIFV